MQKFLVIIALLTCVILPMLVFAQPVVRQDSIAGLYTPDSSVRYAVGDLATLPPDYQPYIRYISLYNVSKSERREIAKLVSFTINSLSKRRKMYIPVFVGASDETVIRLNLKDYDIDPREWDNLGKNGSGPHPFPEPYFNAFVIRIDHGIIDKKISKTKKVPTGRYIQGPKGVQPEFREEKIEAYEKVKNEAAVTSRKLLPAPWIDSFSIQTLIQGTQSQFPIFRADWFIVYSTVEPAYHKLLGLGESEKDFEKVVFANEDLAKQARSQDQGIVVKSSVARNNRALLRSPTFTNGYIWKSFDTLRSIDDRNYVQNIIHLNSDATEIIASLPNGLQAYFVADNKGKRLDAANNEIATDWMAADKIVRNGRSCMYCHSPGINPIQDEIRTLNKKLQNREQVALLVANEKDAYQIYDLFSSNLDRQITRDQQIYSDAMGEATGAAPIAVSQSYFSHWEGYTESLLTKQIMARDLAMSVPELEKYARLSNDPLFLELVRDPIGPVRRDQFERSFQDFLVLVMRAKLNERPGVVPSIILDQDQLKGKLKDQK